MDDPAEHGHQAPSEAVEETAGTEDGTSSADDVVQAGTMPTDEVGGSSHPAVDEVLRSLERLEDVPVDEHVDAFERAHEELRRALSEARDSGD